MTTANAVLNGVPAGTELGKGVGLPGRTAITWAVGGAIGLGGVVVGLSALTGNLSGNGLLMTSMALFLIGGVLGFAHGAVLGVMGRPADMPRGRAVRAIALAAAYTVPALTIAFIVAGWIALTPVAIYTGKILALVGCGVAWVIGTGLITYAALTGWRALAGAYARWEEKRFGTALVAATFAGLLVLFLAKRPELWGVHMQMTEVGAVLLAISLTLWLVGPVVTLALRAAKKIALPGIAFDQPARVLPGVAIGMAVGAVLALIALPFAQARYGVTPSAETGPLGALVVAMSAALFNEVVIRLFVVTAVAALALRLFATRRPQAVTFAVLAAAAVEVIVNLPGVVMIGFPTVWTAGAFMLTAVVLPAIVLGVLFWKRGLTTAVVAHATALATIAIFAA
jgi:hypothetical protein